MLALIVLFANPGWAQMSGRDIMLKVEKQQEVKARVVKSKMILVNKQNKTRERDVLQYTKSVNDPNGIDDKILVFFEYPADIRGTGLLMISYTDIKKDDDRWLYLPALKKVRRIAGESKNEYFMGTDFTYDDMGGRGIDQDTHKLLGEETIDGVKCYKIESVPVDKNDLYSKKIGWVIADKWVHLKVEFYDRKGQLLKTMQATDIRNVSGVWLQFNLEMTNFAENHKTILKILEAKINEPIDDQIFTTTALERGGIK
jgi:hypothetical protein